MTVVLLLLLWIMKSLFGSCQMFKIRNPEYMMVLEFRSHNLFGLIAMEWLCFSL